MGGGGGGLKTPELLKRQIKPGLNRANNAYTLIKIQCCFKRQYGKFFMKV